MNQNPMNHEEEAVAILRRLGFTAKELDRVSRLRRAFAKPHVMDQADLDLRHLQFVRWLVETGKLTDQLA